MGKKVFGAGLIAADHIFIKGKNKLKYLGTSGGGSVGNTLCLLSLLEHNCSIFGVVGNNSISNIIENDFDLFNVSSSLLVRRGKTNEYIKSRQYSHIINEEKNKHSFGRKCLKCGEKFTRDFQLSNRDITKSVKKNAIDADVIHLDRANNITIKIATEAKENNVPVTIDLGYIMFRRNDIIKKLIEKSILVKLNNNVFQQIIGENKEKGIEKWQEIYPNVKTLIITNGKNGVHGYSTTGSRIFPFNEKAIPCKRLVDQSGAGDTLMSLLISELILKKNKKSKNDIIHSIKLGQALASLNCSLYGARSLQRVFLKQDIKGKKILKIAENILKDRESGNSFDPKLGIPESYKHFFRFSPESICSICGSSGIKRKKRKIPEKQSVYIANLSQSYIVMARAFHNSISKRNKYEIFRNKPVIFIGSGGSLSAGIFAEEMMLKFYGIPAKAISPYHLENFKNIDPNQPFCILSYGGNNSDIIGAALRLAKSNIRNCLVLCGDKKSKIFKISERLNWSFIELPGQERSFVTTVGMLAMISSLISLLEPDVKIEQSKEIFEHDNLINILKRSVSYAIENSKYFDRAKNNLHMVCVASGWGIPALVDFESKIVEGGICTIETAEMKNFTHGRYINTFFNKPNRAMIIFESPEEKELSLFLQKKFKNIKPTIVIKTEKHGVDGALELMIKGLYLAWYIGERKGRDIASPEKYPAEARGLYGWEPKYREGKDFFDLLKNK